MSSSDDDYEEPVKPEKKRKRARKNDDTKSKKKKQGESWFVAGKKVLQQKKKPMHYTEIADEIIKLGYRKIPDGTKVPYHSLNAVLSTHSKKHSTFYVTEKGRGTYGLIEWLSDEERKNLPAPGDSKDTKKRGKKKTVKRKVKKEKAVKARVFRKGEVIDDDDEFEIEKKPAKKEKKIKKRIVVRGEFEKKIDENDDFDDDIYDDIDTRSPLKQNVSPQKFANAPSIPKIPKIPKRRIPKATATNVGKVSLFSGPIQKHFSFDVLKLIKNLGGFIKDASHIGDDSNQKTILQTIEFTTNLFNFKMELITFNLSFVVSGIGNELEILRSNYVDNSGFTVCIDRSNNPQKYFIVGVQKENSKDFIVFIFENMGRGKFEKVIEIPLRLFLEHLESRG